MVRPSLHGGVSNSNWLHFLLYWCTKRDPAWAAQYIYLVPSLTANLDYIFFKTKITASLLIGSAMVVGGLIVGNYKTGQQKST